VAKYWVVQYSLFDLLIDLGVINALT